MRIDSKNNLGGNCPINGILSEELHDVYGIPFVIMTVTKLLILRRSESSPGFSTVNSSN